MDELVRVESIAPETYDILVVRLLCADPDRPFSPPQIRGCVEERLGIFNARDRYLIEFEYMISGRPRWQNQLYNTF